MISEYNVWSVKYTTRTKGGEHHCSVNLEYIVADDPEDALDIARRLVQPRELILHALKSAGFKVLIEDRD